MWPLFLFVASWSVYNQDGHVNRDGLGYHERVSYYVNYDPISFKDYHDDVRFKY